MIRIVKIISSSVENGIRRLKVLKLGRADSRQSIEAAPFGDDSHPLKDMTAIYAETGQKGKSVIIGFINSKQLAALGEKRIYSLQTDGQLSTYIHLKNDLQMELGGTGDRAVRFAPLKDGFDDLVDKVNEMIDEWNLFAAAYVPGGPTPVGTPPTVNTVASASSMINFAEIDEIEVQGI